MKKQFIDIVLGLVQDKVPGIIQPVAQTRYGATFAVTDAQGVAHVLEAVPARDDDKIYTAVMPTGRNGRRAK